MKKYRRGWGWEVDPHCHPTSSIAESRVAFSCDLFLLLLPFLFQLLGVHPCRRVRAGNPFNEMPMKDTAAQEAPRGNSCPCRQLVEFIFLP
jgi:hypothetical protein